MTAGHPALALLSEQGLEAEDEIVLRRIVTKDGRSRAFINDQPAGVALLRRIGALLVEVQGQHEQMGLADPASHTTLLDLFGVPPECRDAVAGAWRAWRQAVHRLDTAREAIESARRDEEWLRHAVDELATLAPRLNEEDQLVADRQRLQQNERQAEAIAAAIAELAPRDRRGAAGPASVLRSASRLLQRLVPAHLADQANPAQAALAALERAEEALAEADHDPWPPRRRRGRRSPPAGTNRGAVVRAACRRAQTWRRRGGTAGVAGYVERTSGRS